MPAKSPRLCVSISEEQHSLLLELGSLQGRSAASYLREMLDATTPMLAAVLPIYRAAAAQAAIQPELLQQTIRDAIAGFEANQSQLDLLEHLAAVTPVLANDQAGSADAAPSGAREDAGASRKRRKRS